ncbi:MAG: hypothetical protein M3Y37_04755 [Chloroflexota bacterium]|nr:hypothetical protein [Chloroflexota bacterium]
MIQDRRPVSFLAPLIAALILLVWAWRKLGFFTLQQTVSGPDGTPVRMPNALATVDHPFHAARFSVFLDAVRNGGVPRWVMGYQGGYPSEFYPFGSAVLDLIVWALSLGQLSLPMVHTWSVAVTFGLPVLGLLLLVHFAGLNLWAGVAAAAAHLCVRGWWWSGGSYELVEWGLITNVLAAAQVFLILVLAGGVLAGRSVRLFAPIALLTGWAIWTNPRSGIALLTVAVAIAIVVLIERADGSAIRRLVVLAVPFLLGIGFAAPLVASLIRYNSLYFFVHYSGYEDIGAWWDSSKQAVSSPVLAAAVVGLVAVFTLPSTPMERLLSWTTIVYLLMTAWLVRVDWPGGWVEQLETTRLMPFQRLLMLALAGVALGKVASLVGSRWPEFALIGVTCAVPLAYVIQPPSWVPESDRGLVRIGTMAEPGIADLRVAVKEGDRVAPAGTAMLILGTTRYWHDHKWAELWTDRQLFFDDWLWWWQREHVGVYDPEIEHSYPIDSTALDAEFLRIHGIGVVVVTGQAAGPARGLDYLTPVRTGTYDVYLVNDYRTTATIDEQPLVAEISRENVVVPNLPAEGGTILLRVNWFARWTASAEGADLPVVHRPDGYMEVAVPPGVSAVTFTYARTSLDWAMLLLALGSGLLVLGLAVRPPNVLRSAVAPRPDQVTDAARPTVPLGPQ